MGRIHKVRTVSSSVVRPELIAQHQRGTAKEAICGEFERIIDWKLVGVTGPGLIVQRVKKHFLITNVATGKTMTASEIDSYVAPSGGETRLSGWLKYWEVWVVPSGKDKPSHGDSFSLAAIVDQLGSGRNTTKGWFQMVGEAHFYQTSEAPSKFGFQRGVRTNPANGLPWSVVAPTGLPAPVGRLLTHTVKVQWDSTKEDPKNRGEYGPTKVVINSFSFS